MPTSAPATSRAPHSFAGRRRQQCLGQLDQTPDELQRARPEGELRPAGGPEQVGDEGKRRAGNVGEQQRRPAGGDDPPVNLRRFEDRVDRRLDDRQVAVTPQPVDERTKVGESATRHEYAADNTSPGAPAAVLPVGLLLVAGIRGGRRGLTRVVASAARIAGRLGARSYDAGVVDEVVEHQRAHAPPCDRLFTETSRPTRRAGHRRPPPEATAAACAARNMSCGRAGTAGGPASAPARSRGEVPRSTRRRRGGTSAPPPHLRQRRTTTSFEPSHRLAVRHRTNVRAAGRHADYRQERAISAPLSIGTDPTGGRTATMRA